MASMAERLDAGCAYGRYSAMSQAPCPTKARGSLACSERVWPAVMSVEGVWRTDFALVSAVGFGVVIVVGGFADPLESRRGYSPDRLECGGVAWEGDFLVIDRHIVMCFGLVVCGTASPGASRQVQTTARCLHGWRERHGVASGRRTPCRPRRLAACSPTKISLARPDPI